MTLKTRGGRDGALSMWMYRERESVFEEKEGRTRDGAGGVVRRGGGWCSSSSSSSLAVTQH